ncbi:hypothetical protein F1654_03520 [Alkalicaulis satelles]|uniref:Uncharacterized protein n=1 Tax=Alkalicaulis satelles TaxID=2609175 RepID=A0A5M6ZJS0_9PROT|nr:hypothetical protein [Alkalicaulis satelles]KAA5805072.1 hypothetical protein F1654_03520 [Alkalicaulis satelles]
MTGVLPAHDSALWRDRAAAAAQLEALGARGRLDDADRDFLLFCLRASDPAVYQPAALAAGRLAGDDPDLRAALEDYARSAGASLGSPIKLNGRRSARRLSLVLAGAGETGQSPPGWAHTPFEQPALTPESAAIAPADLANMMLALTRLCGAGRHDFHNHADALLTFMARTPGALRDAPAARRFAQLLAARATGGADMSGALADALAQAQSLAGEDAMSARLEALRLMSELARAVIEAPGLAIPALASAPEALRLAGQSWARRAGRPAPDWTAMEAARGGVMEALRQREALGDENARLACLDALTAPLAGEGEWRWLAPDARALVMHALIDQLRHDPPPPERAQALALRRGLLAGGGDLMSAVVLRLIALEGEGAGPLVDYPLVHAISDPALLAALAPARAQSGRAELIADAVENRLRNGLRSQPGFDPAPWLLLILARKPAPGVLAHLRRLCEGRRYESAAGEDYPLDALLARLAMLTGGADAPRSASALLEAAFALRAELVQETGDALALDDAVSGLASLVDESEAGGSASLILLMRAIQPARALMIAGPEPAVLTQDAGAFCDELAALTARMRARVRWLAPDAWLKPDSARAGLAELAALLRELAARSAPVLPAGLDRSVTQACETLAQRVQARAQALTRLDGAWQDGERTLTALLAAAGEALDGPDGARLAGAILDRLSPGVPLGAAHADDAPASEDARIDAHWRQGRAQLDEALKLDIEGPHWTGAVQRLWEGLMRAAMAEQHEGRVRALLLERPYQAIRRNPASAALMRAARLWCLDRYRPWSAYGAARDLAAGAGERAPSPLSALPALGARLAPLWICLLIGAILMLDFGDAWRAMAEDGDVRGVAITFAIGLGGACAYLFHHLAQRCTPEPGRARAGARLSVAVRALGVAGACFVYALGVTALLWLLLSGTDEVVRGPYASLHIIVWAGFSLFIGVFFGLVAKRN